MGRVTTSDPTPIQTPVPVPTGSGKVIPAGPGKVVPAGPGKVVSSGPGKVVSAGRGTGHWHTYDVTDGLAGANVWSILQDREGKLWIGTFTGVSRYDGRKFTTFTAKDGLAHNAVNSIFQDREGHLWFGTMGGGVSRYDGKVFQRVTREDGLASNSVWSVFEDREGHLWFGTTNGVTRHRPPAPSPPPVFIDAVVADRRYEGVSELSIPSTVGITIFEFHGMSLKTRPEQMVYRYRLRDYDEDWKATRERRVEYHDLPVGDCTFEVVAVDRDLVYSEKPATVRLTVTPDPRIEALAEALSGASGEFVGTSEALRKVQTQLSWVAQTDVTALILGETGTGKGLAARERMALHLNKQVTHLTPEALTLLNAYDWPGNIRELEHAVQRAVIVSRGPAIRAEDIVLEFGKGGGSSAEEIMTLEEHERRYIREVLEKTGWVIGGAHGAAALLGVPASTLRSRMKKLDILRR